MDSSDLLPFLTTRSSVREYHTAPVSDEELGYLLRCASTAPSAGDLEAWDVVVVTERATRQALSTAALGQRHVAAAPLVLVVCANHTRSMTRYGGRGTLYAVQDATIACTYLMLAAHALGLHTCWTGAFDEGEVRRIVHLPDGILPIALLPIGHGNPPISRTPRMPVENHLHHERW